MTKTLLLPTRQGRRRVRHDLANDAVTAGQEYLSAALHPAPVPGVAPSTHVSDHNIRCEQTENDERLKRWIEDQQEQEALWQFKVQQPLKTPPPVPPRPKANLLGSTALPPQPLPPDFDPWYQQQQTRPDQRLDQPWSPRKHESEIEPEHDCADIVYPALPPEPSLTTAIASDFHDTATVHVAPDDGTDRPSYISSPPSGPLTLGAAVCSPSSTSRTLPNPANIRTFTDATDAFKVSAEFVDFAYGHVRMHKANGHVIAVPLSRLSGEDIRYVMGEMERRAGVRSRIGDQT